MRCAPRIGAALILLVSTMLQAPTHVDAQERPGWIGVSVNVLTTADDAGVRTSVVVTDVQPGSPAAVAGIRPGDTLMEVNDMRGPDALRQIASQLQLSVGDPVRLVLRRGEQSQEVSLVAAARPQILTRPGPLPPVPSLHTDSMVASIVQAMDSLRIRLSEQRDAARRVRIQVAPSAPSPAPPAAPRRIMIDASGAYSPLAPYVLGRNRVAGAEVIDVGPDLARYFGVDGGVLLIDVSAGTPAAAARLRAGDVIVELGGAPVHSIEDLRLAVARSSGDATLVLIRHGERISTVLPNR